MRGRVSAQSIDCRSFVLCEGIIESVEDLPFEEYSPRSGFEQLSYALLK